MTNIKENWLFSAYTRLKDLAHIQLEGGPFVLSSEIVEQAVKHTAAFYGKSLDTVSPEQITELLSYAFKPMPGTPRQFIPQLLLHTQDKFVIAGVRDTLPASNRQIALSSAQVDTEALLFNGIRAATFRSLEEVDQDPNHLWLGVQEMLRVIYSDRYAHTTPDALRHFYADRLITQATQMDRTRSKAQVLEAYVESEKKHSADRVILATQLWTPDDIRLITSTAEAITESLNDADPQAAETRMAAVTLWSLAHLLAQSKPEEAPSASSRFLEAALGIFSSRRVTAKQSETSRIQALINKEKARLRQRPSLQARLRRIQDTINPTTPSRLKSELAYTAQADESLTNNIMSMLDIRDWEFQPKRSPIEVLGEDVIIADDGDETQSEAPTTEGRIIYEQPRLDLGAIDEAAHANHAIGHNPITHHAPVNRIAVVVRRAPRLVEAHIR